MRSAEATLTTSTLLLLSGCAYDPKATADDDMVARLETLEASYSALAEEIANLNAVNATCQVAISEQQEQIDSLNSDLATTSGLPRFIDTDLTLNVPTEYADINVALAALNGSIISQSATVTIQLADGSYNYDQAINVAHENGDRIQILGNVVDPSAVSIIFSESGFEITNGHSLGLIQGMTLLGNGDTSGTPYGVMVKDNGFAVVSDLITSSFYADYAAHRGGVLYADGTNDYGSSRGFQSTGGSVVTAELSMVIGSTTGYYSEGGSYLDADYSSASGIGEDCYEQYGGYMDATEATAESCAHAGFMSSGSGMIHGVGAQVTSSSSDAGSYGFAAQDGGVLSVSTSSVTGVTTGYFAEYSGHIDAREANSLENSYGFRVKQGGAINARDSTSTDDATSYSPTTSAGTYDDIYVWFD